MWSPGQSLAFDRLGSIRTLTSSNQWVPRIKVRLLKVYLPPYSKVSGSSEKVALNRVGSGEKLSRRHLGELTGSIRPIRASTLATLLGSRFCEIVLLQRKEH